jgi:tetratricopeptide (TPR) repeat protein
MVAAIRKMRFWCVGIFVFVALVVGKPCLAQNLDPFDTDPLWGVPVDADDTKKSAAQLLAEAQALLSDERPLDARSKLLLALKKDPKSFEVHTNLAHYYMSQVGHYRLALKYIKRAGELLVESHGEPPYKQYKVQTQHALYLYMLSQVRLNLDNYQGALDALDEYTKQGYYSDWYPGSRAWILMKLGRPEEAIRVAQVGLAAMVSSTEKGQILNILGILLSMTKQRSLSLEVFRKAIAHESSLGRYGQPATPLNNSGEVYKEIFEEERAEDAWTKAISMQDGCEHVLPTLNLVLLYIEQLRLPRAEEALNRFESCVAQYPLRNGEEHRALVHMARGRIALLRGDLDGAEKHLHGALERQQWFGKIGASTEDLATGTLLSLGRLYEVRARFLNATPQASLIESFSTRAALVSDELRSWWYYRKGMRLLLEDLNDFEDLTVRTTDSLLEYPTLGSALTRIDGASLRARLERLLHGDERKRSHRYYELYQAELHLLRGEIAEGMIGIKRVLAEVRPVHDNLIEAHALGLALTHGALSQQEYAEHAVRLFRLNRAHIRISGVRLPVNYTVPDDESRELFEDTPFLLDNNVKLPYRIKVEHNRGEYLVQFFSLDDSIGSIKVSGVELVDALKKLSDEVFSSKS